MNKEWSDLNKKLQLQLKKKDSFHDGITSLLALRQELLEQIIEFKRTLSKEQFCAIPFINAKGYHSKTIAYSLYHIFRIEDIVVHTLVIRDEQVYFTGEYQTKMHSPIKTTGNELVKAEIADFSNQLDIEELYHYIIEVDHSTTSMLKLLNYSDLKTQYTDEDKLRIRALNVVSESEDAIWLIDYWCSKDLKGLLQMPLSRHWIMHIEASLRIMKKLLSK